MNVEVVNTEWFDEGAMRLPNYRVGRVNYGNGRAYIKILGDGELEQPFRLYTSLTTAIHQASPMAKPLLEWYCKHGYEEAKRLANIAANYGTLLHLVIGEYIINHAFDFDTVTDRVRQYCLENKYTYPETKEWQWKLRDDMAAYIQFHHDYKVKPLAVEYVLVSDKGFGTLIDLVCKMTIEEKGFFGEVYKSGERKGEPKESKKEREITAIINFKSGRNGFHESNGLQILCEKQLFEENFPDIKIEAAFNWAPKEWKGKPSYHLKDWTGNFTNEEIDAMLILANIRFGEKALEREYTSFSGLAIEGRGLSEVMTFERVEDYCRRKFSSTPTV